MRQDKQEIFTEGYLLWDTFEYLTRTIIYYLSPEMRGHVRAFDAPQAIAAADLLAFLCEHYEMSPEVPEKVVRGWRETYLEIWKQEGFEGDDRLKVVEATFDRLEMVARRYPCDWVD